MMASVTLAWFSLRYAYAATCWGAGGRGLASSSPRRGIWIMTDPFDGLRLDRDVYAPCRSCVPAQAVSTSLPVHSCISRFRGGNGGSFSVNGFALSHALRRLVWAKLRAACPAVSGLALAMP